MNSLRRTKIYFTAKIAATLLLCATVGASSALADAASFSSAQAEVRTLVTQLLGDAKSMKQLYETDKQKYYARVQEVAVSAIAMNLVSRFVLGRHWKLADAAQREQFVRAMEMMLVKSYGKALVVLEDAKIEYLPANIPGNTRKQTVRTRLTTASNTHINIDYVVLKLNDEWKIFDLVVDGLSMVKQLRGSFDLEIKEAGLNALIARLQSES